MPFQRRRKCIFYWRGQAWLTIWDRVKIPRYSHRLMHQKRVTCELHDSYFRWMTIKHAIPRTVEVTHSDGQLWGDIEWRELLYNSLKTGSQSVWRSENLERRCGRESQHSAVSLAPGLRLSSTGERERNAVMVNRVGVNMLQFCLVSNSLSHTNLSNEVRGTYFSKELCHSSLLLCRCYDFAYLCVCIVGHGHGYTTFLC